MSFRSIQPPETINIGQMQFHCPMVVLLWFLGGGGIRGRVYDANGLPIGPELQLDTQPSGGYDFGLRVLSDGQFMITSQGYDPLIAGGTGIVGHIYEVTSGGVAALFTTDDDTVVLSDIINDVRSLSGDDVITGGLLRDTIRGEDDNDIISGDGGDDTVSAPQGTVYYGVVYGNNNMHGGAGNDHLNGGHGDGILYGGAGADVFVFDTFFAVDTVAGFQLGTDSLDFRP